MVQNIYVWADAHKGLWLRVSLKSDTCMQKHSLEKQTCFMIHAYSVHFDRLYQRKCLKTFFTTIVNMLVELSFKKANAICQTLVDKWTRLCMTILCCNLCTPYFVFELLLLSFRGVLLSTWMLLTYLIAMKTQILMEGETWRKLMVFKASIFFTYHCPLTSYKTVKTVTAF